MNFDEMDADIQSVEKSANDLVITDAKTYENAQRFSQHVSHINIWLTKLQHALNTSSNIVTKKLSDYERNKKPSPSPNACVACSGSGKSSSGHHCTPCNGTGKKGIVSDPPKAGASPVGYPEPAKTPAIQASAPKVDPAPTLSLDDFDEGPVSEDDELAVELQKSLF